MSRQEIWMVEELREEMLQNDGRKDAPSEWTKSTKLKQATFKATPVNLGFYLQCSTILME